MEKVPLSRSGSPFQRLSPFLLHFRKYEIKATPLEKGMMQTIGDFTNVLNIDHFCSEYRHSNKYIKNHNLHFQKTTSEKATQHSYSLHWADIHSYPLHWADVGLHHSYSLHWADVHSYPLHWADVALGRRWSPTPFTGQTLHLWQWSCLSFLQLLASTFDFLPRVLGVWRKGKLHPGSTPPTTTCTCNICFVL